MKAIRKIAAGLALSVILMSGSVSMAHHGDHSSHHSNYYYCHGHNAHLHPNGVCPYRSSTDPCYRKATVRKVQNKLTSLGYKCGKTDGIYDAKMRKAIKKYQGKKGLAVNGKINKALLKKLKISI